jgi:hypothetical protein
MQTYILVVGKNDSYQMLIPKHILNKSIVFLKYLCEYDHDVEYEKYVKYNNPIYQKNQMICIFYIAHPEITQQDWIALNSQNQQSQNIIFKHYF